MANTYNPYSDIKSIYDLKGKWDEANKAGDKNKMNSIAATAQAYYDKLKNNDYGGVATALSSVGYNDAKAILDSYSPTTTNTTTKSPVETNNLKSNEINRENAGLFDKYNKTYDDLKNTNPFKTDEAKAIMGKYDLAGLQARDNVVANGGASNGGNIDSYASANAMRQQASLVSQGQTAVLNAHQQKIDNIRGILSDMGVNIDRVFNQDETSKNNDVARKSEIASVTGVVPDEWVVSNNPYMNENGTIKDEFKDVDFSAVMAKAKASGNTAAYNAAATARYYKIMNDYGAYGQYDDGNYLVPGEKQTEARRQFDVNSSIARESLTNEKEINDANNQNKIDQIKAQTEGEKDILKFTKELTDTTTGYTLTDEDKNMAELVVKNINANLKTHTSNPDGRDLISYKDGTVLLNLPTGHVAHWWATQILKPLFQSNLNANACYAIARELGFSEDDITSVANAIK